MATIITREVGATAKGSTLSNTELDNNFINLNTDIGTRIPSSEKGSANGVATLDATGKVPSTQLPSYVDDVLEAANLAAFPATGETSKIYVALDTNKTYRWSGSAYVYITSGAVDSVAGKTGVVTLVKGDVGLGSVDNTADSAKNVLSATKLTTARTIGGVSFDGTANINLPGVNATGNQNIAGTNVSGDATALSIAAASSTASGVGGDLTISAGSTPSTTAAKNGGTLLIKAGDNTSASGGYGSYLQLYPGAAVLGTGGQARLYSGDSKGTNIDGTDLMLFTGRGTGTGLGGTIRFYTSTATTAGTGLQSHQSRLEIDPTGQVFARANIASTSTTTGTLKVTGGVGVSGQVYAAGFNGPLTGNATTATTLQTARTLTIGSTGKTFNGSANVAWSLAEIGALGASAKAADSELLDGYNSTAFSGPVSTIKEFFWDNLSASGTQARTFEIARLAVDYNDWNGGIGPFEVELYEAYYSRGLKKKYVIHWGYTNTYGIQLVEFSGSGDNNFQVRVGTPVLVSGDNYYLPVYVDVRYYSGVDVRVTTNRDITSSNPPGIGTAYINASPSATNISDFTPDSIVNFSSVSTVQVAGNQLLHAGNYSSYALPLSGGTLTGTLYTPKVIINASNDLSWGGNYGDGKSTISATGSAIYLYPAGNGSGATLTIDNSSTNVYRELYVSTGGSSQVRVASPSGTQSLWIRAGYTADGTATPQSSPYNVQFQSSGSSGGTFSFCTGNDVTLSITGSYVNSAVALQQGGNQVLHAGNYNSYAPTLTGTGASGTWGINVTGSAGSVAWSGVTGKPTTLAGYGITDAAASSHTHSYLPLSGGTVTGDLLVQGTSSRFPSHFYHYEYDAAGNVYEHYYAPGSENVKNSTANLRVSATSGYYKVLAFSGDGSFTWNGNAVLTAGNYTNYVGNGAMSITAGAGLTGGGQVGTANQSGSSSVTISHADTSSQASVDGSGGTVIQDITLDTYGHITGIGTTNLDSRYVETNGYIDFTVDGDANTYYPVLLSGSKAYAWGTYNVTRGYSWTAPSTWNTATHKGGLTLSFRWSGDTGWGGNDHNVIVEQFSEQYSNMVGGMVLTTSGLIVFLRGGTAQYRYYSPSGVLASATVYLSGYTASNGTVYNTRANNSLNSEVYANWPVRNTTVYSRNYQTLDTGNYNSYSPTLTGGGASGTWSISISGNASTATYTANSSKLYSTDSTYAYGSANPYYGYLTYNSPANRWRFQVSPATPSAIEVAYSDSSGTAGSATSAGYLTGGDSAFYAYLYNSNSGDLNTYNSPGLYSSEYIGGTNNPAGTTGQNGHWIQISDAGGTDVKTQWYYHNGGSDISMRLMWGNGNWRSWRKLLHDGNYNSYSPTLTGGGASGTWGISISGNAATANSSPLLSGLGTYVWSASTLPASYSNGIQASFVQASNGFQNYGSVMTMNTYSGGGGALQLYVPYSPTYGGTGLQVRFGNYDVSTGNSWTAWKTLLASDNYNSYAPTLTGGGASGTWGITISGSAGRLTNFTSTTTSSAGTDNAESCTSYISGISLFSQTDGALYSHVYSSSWKHNIYGDYRTGQLAVRGKNNGTWQAWRTVIDSGNYSSYALPLSGGTVTGATYFQSNQGTTSGSLSSPPLQAYATGTNAAYMSFHRSGSYAVNMGLDSDNVLRIGGWSASANRFQMDMSGNLTMAGNITAYSDERLKTDWSPLPLDFVERLAKIKSGTYTRIDSGERQAGASAQDWQQLLPEVVTTGADEEKILALAYGNAALVSAVELAKEVVSLRDKLSKLEDLVQALINKG